ncbi:ATP-dependent helicase HrpB [Vibrio sp. 10N.286.49.B3]|nr:ATP-dependent helicase HrpB [Vibrio sp. 10N.286.49.B3]
MPELLSSIDSYQQVILKAAPGAGKSTYFPLQLIKSGKVAGKIIMLEPRRLAARNIAQYLADQVGESVGDSIGFRIRGETKVSSNTQLEIVTEGVMTRLIQSDPELEGVGMVIFDEYHERSIHADTALALSLDIQAALRDDLTIVVMSATLDQGALCDLLPSATYIESQGRSYPVEYRYQPMKVNERLVPCMVRHIEALIANETGSLLAFLPGVNTIQQVAQELKHLAAEVDIYPLYGQLTKQAQQKAIAPSQHGKRKVVLATNIAETSLTIEGIRLVVDSGFERVARFDLKTGITRLEQVRIAQSSAEQRAGRAGRLDSGICVRLYSEAQLKQQAMVPLPEIMQADLTGLSMELAYWGARDATTLSWLDAPANSAWQQAQDLLHTLKLVEPDSQYPIGQLTAKGKKAYHLGLEPRVGSMLVRVADKVSLNERFVPQWLHTSILVAALLEEPERSVFDFQDSIQHFLQGSHINARLVEQRIRSLSNKLNVHFKPQLVDTSLVAMLLTLAFPDRVAQLRSNSSGDSSSGFILSNGHGAFIAEGKPLAQNRYVIAIDLMRSQQGASQIFLACELDIERLEAFFPEQFISEERVDWDEKRGRLIAEKLQRIGHIIIDKQRLPEPDKAKITEALLNYIRRKGLDSLHWDEATTQLLTRIRCGAQWLPEQPWPAMDNDSLLAELADWLAPYMTGVSSVKGLRSIPLSQALLARLGWPLNQQLDDWLPTHHSVPTGSRKKIHYQIGVDPMLSVRMQEVFGEHDSPRIAQGRVKIVLELLSPAQRPLQVTQDLAGFWRGSYKDVQKEMKGRYPKHVWPDDPANHIATTKTKRQLN